MAKFISLLVIAVIFLISVTQIQARRNGPLLIEDDGSRRNRPAGEFS